MAGLYTTGLAKGRLPAHPGGTLSAYRTIAAAEGANAAALPPQPLWLSHAMLREAASLVLFGSGVGGLFRGWQPTMYRAALITAGLTVGYDQVRWAASLRV